jgi:uncharacterized protein YegJ (DUF2314 family)
LVLSVPETLTTVYLVPTARPPANPRELARDRVAEMGDGRLRELALRMLDGPIIKVDSVPGDRVRLPPRPVLAAFAASADHLDAVEKAAGFVLVHARYQPGWPPAHEWVARLIAVELALHLGSPVVDTFVPQVLDPERALRSLPTEGVRRRLVEWVQVLHSPGPDGFWFSTKGLRRFGLPELQAINVPPGLIRPWTSVFNGIAHVLVRRWYRVLRLAGAGEDLPAFVELPRRLEVGRSDIAAAHGAVEDDGGKATVELVFDPPSDPSAEPFLTVTAPVYYPASTGEFLTGVCRTVFGREEEEITFASDSSAMQRAIESARAELDKARARFAQRELPSGSHLIVKYRVAVPLGNEYVWAFVTGWSDDGTIRGSSANDAELDATVRVGRPVVVREEDVVDWAVWADGRGIVEGGWTEGAL